MSASDAIRSLLAQRAYVGDDLMEQLWYPVAFLDERSQQESGVKTLMKESKKRLKWAGDPLPTARWLAQQASNETLYNYLHAAASRALHFSMGEVMRNAWGQPGEILTTLKPEFRGYRTAFALDQLPHLFQQTFQASLDLLEESVLVVSTEDDVLDDFTKTSIALKKLGKIR